MTTGSRDKRSQETEFTCIGECSDDYPVWMVDGRFQADGTFMPVDVDDADCPECGERGEPTNGEVLLADW